jgi:dolichyl-phosphate-mannose--protein O-mannosyl transferase
VQNVFALGNPVLYWAFLPAVAWFGFQWRARKFDAAHGLVLLGFFGNWLPWALSPRIAFLYHFLPSVPFGCLALALFLKQQDETGRDWLMWIYLAALFLSFVYFYPHLAACPISIEYSLGHFWLPGWKPLAHYF